MDVSLSRPWLIDVESLQLIVNIFGFVAGAQERESVIILCVFVSSQDLKPSRENAVMHLVQPDVRALPSLDTAAVAHPLFPGPRCRNSSGWVVQLVPFFGL